MPTNEGACSSSSQSENVSIQEKQIIQFTPTTEKSLSSNNVFEDQKSYSIQPDPDNQTCESRSAQTALSVDTRKRKLSVELNEVTKDQKCDLDYVTEEQFLKLCDKFMTEGMFMPHAIIIGIIS